jgi:hypothetical protein
MSDKTNDEKLRVLQERLAQIKQKQDTTETYRRQNESVNVIENSIKDTRIDKKPLNLSWIKKIVIIGTIAYGIFYGFTNFDSLVTNLKSDEATQELYPKKLEYNLNLKGNNIAIITTSSSITDEGTAKAMVNDLKIKGFKCDYIYLPENSNFKDKVYQVFIGPYENIEETNQWAKNLNLEFNIITL